MIRRLLAIAGRVLGREELKALRLRVMALEGITDSLSEELENVRGVVDEHHLGLGAIGERGRYG